MKRLVILTLLVFSFGVLFSQNTGNEMLSLTKIQKNVKTKRVSSYDKTGGNGDCWSGIAPGEKRTIMDVKGAGIHRPHLDYHCS